MCFVSSSIDSKKIIILEISIETRFLKMSESHPTCFQPIKFSESFNIAIKAQQTCFQPIKFTESSYIQSGYL